MRRPMRRRSACILWLTLCLAGCSPKEAPQTPSRTPAYTRLEAWSDNKLSLGDTIRLGVKLGLKSDPKSDLKSDPKSDLKSDPKSDLKSDPKPTDTIPSIPDIVIDTVRLWQGQGLLWEGAGEETIRISTASMPTGRQLFRIEALLSHGHREQHGYGLVLLAAEAPVPYGYRKQRAFPHDKEAYTQGLCFHDGVLYESTGRYGTSTLRRVALESGKVLTQHALDSKHFAEGIALWEDKIYLLTWKAHKGFIYTRDDLEEVGTFAYPTEGWGLSTWKGFFVMSDGSEKLYFYTPQPWTFSHSLQVYDDQAAVKNLNELETIGDELYANVYGENYIVVIDPHTGAVTKRIDLEGLLEEDNEKADVLNGMAYDSLGKRLYVTGKLWPYLFEIQPVPR